MPIYEYKCRTCGTTFEVLMASRQDKAVNCRKCGGFEVERIMSAAAVLRSERKPLKGHTCCGREERCEMPPCSTQGGCGRS